MATKLTQEDRHALKDFAIDEVNRIHPHVSTLRDTAYQLVTRAITDRFPPGEMDVLRMYNFAERVHNITLEVPKIGYPDEEIEFNFESGDPVFLPADTDARIVVSAACADAVHAFVEERYDPVARDDIVGALWALVDAAKTREGLYAIWGSAVDEIDPTT